MKHESQVVYMAEVSANHLSCFDRAKQIVKAVAGGQINLEDVKSIWPGEGAPPKLLDQLLGKTLPANFSAGTPLSLEMIYS